MGFGAVFDSSTWIFVAVGIGVVATLGYGIAIRLALVDESQGRRPILPAPKTLHGRLLAGLLLLALVPPLGLGISLGHRQLAQNREQSFSLIASASDSVALELDEQMDGARASVAAAAEGLALVPAYEEPGLAPLLIRYHALAPGFLTMLVTDAEGRILAASRGTADGPAATSSSDRSVADRRYFSEPMRTGQTYVSEVFQGRGLGRDPIVAVSAAIVRDGRRVGVVEGSLDLRRFSKLERRYAFESAGASLVILDPDHRVIFGSHDTGLQFLDDLSGSPLAVAAPGPRDGTVFVAPGTLSGETGRHWLATHVTTDLGWRVVALVPAATLASQLFEDIGVILLWLLAVLVCALPLAFALQRQVTAPLGLLQQAVERFRIEAGEHDFMSGSAHVAEYRRLFRTMHRFGWRLRGSYRRLEQSLADAKALRNELSAVLARREEEVRERTRELDAANLELQRLARLDALTNLANRRWFNEFLAQAWRVARRESTPLSSILMDVDYFKQFNDTYGHQAGDECLRQVSAVVRRAAGRPLDHAARYGGEEFVVLLSDAPAEAAARIADRLRRAVADLHLPHAGSPFGRVTVSVGLRTVVPSADGTPEHMLTEADAALYEAKRNGRNRVAMHDGAAVRVIEAPPEADQPFRSLASLRR